MTSTRRIPAGEKRIRQLREFARVMCLALVVIGGALLYKGKETSLVFFLVALFFMATGICIPQVLNWPERLWMNFAEKLSVVVTYVSVTLTFYLVITPMGLLIRILGKDLLGLTWDKSKKSYWVPVEQDGPGTRPFTPY